MLDLIRSDYCESLYKDDLEYLAPIIYLDNPASHKILRCDPKIIDMVPERKLLDPYGENGIAIGNITSQYGSNLFLNEIDHFCVDDLGLEMYIRYVDDIVIINKDKSRLLRALPLITQKLSKIGMSISPKKTVVDTCYHGVKFLGKVTYPYGYQKTAKPPAGRLLHNAHIFQVGDESMLSRLNSQIGRLKNYACHNLIHDYINRLPKQVFDTVSYNEQKKKFEYKQKVNSQNQGSEDWFFYSPITGLPQQELPAKNGGQDIE